MVDAIACCGLDCERCRAYIATRSRDKGTAAEIAKLWSNPNEGNYNPEDIWCDGCHSDRLHAFCAKCPVRICVKAKSLDNCGRCRDYPCLKLTALWESWVEASPVLARTNLEKACARTPPS